MCIHISRTVRLFSHLQIVNSSLILFAWNPSKSSTFPFYVGKDVILPFSHRKKYELLSLYYFFSFFLWSCRSEYSDSSPAYILLLYTSWLIWPRCHTTIVNLQWTHMYKKSLLFKNRFVGPQKLKKVETEKHNSFFYLFLSPFFSFLEKTPHFGQFCIRTIVVPFLRRSNEWVKLQFSLFLAKISWKQRYTG